MLVPRKYQSEAVDAILSCLNDPERKWVNPYISASVGTGKSLMAAMLAKALSPQRVLVLVPSQVLMQQNFDEAKAYGLTAHDVGVYCADKKERNKRVTIATYQALARSPKAVGLIAHIVVDEAQGSMTPSHRKIFEAHPNARIIGMTGTPWVMAGGKPVKLERARDPVYGQEVYTTLTPKFFSYMLQEGNYSRIKNGSPLTLIDTAGMRIKAGDFDDAQLSERAVEQAKTHVTEALAQLNEHKREHTMWFCTSIAHAKAIEMQLRMHNEDVFRVTGDMAKNENMDNIDAFMRREYRHIVSVATLTTGFNAKHVDAIVQLRPTKSLPLHVQILGRGIRGYAGKEYTLLLDATDNTVRLGPINAPKAEEDDDTLRGYWQCGKPRQMGVSGLTVQDGLLPEEQRSVFMSETGRPYIRLGGGVDVYATPCSFLNEPQHAFCCNCGTPRDFILRKTAKSDDPRDGDPMLKDNLAARSGASAYDEFADGEDEKRTLVPVFGHTIEYDPSTDLMKIMYITGKGPQFFTLVFGGDDMMAITKSRQLFALSTGKRHLITSGFKAFLLKDFFKTPISVELDDSGLLTRIIFDGKRQWVTSVDKV